MRNDSSARFCQRVFEAERRSRLSGLAALLVCLYVSSTHAYNHQSQALDKGKLTENCIVSNQSVPFELNSYQEDQSLVDQLPAHFKIDHIHITRHNIFDENDPEENNWLYQGANSLHFLSDDNTIRNQLLFESGETIDWQTIEESERRLRKLPYLYGALIRIVSICGNSVDLEVVTRDTWSLQPSVSFKRAGGKNSLGFSFREANFLGWGKQIEIKRRQDEQRTKTLLSYSDTDFLSQQLFLRATYGSNSDGSDKELILSNPWLSVDDKSAWSFRYQSALFSERVFEQQGGNELNQYDHDKQTLSASYGWSSPMGDGYVNRYSLGFTQDDNQFLPNIDTLDSLLIPADRKLAYPWFEWSFTSTRYQKRKNFNFIDVIEDVYVGSEGALKVGYSSDSLGADINAFVFDLDYRVKLFGDDNNLFFLGLNSDGYVKQGESRISNGLTQTSLQYYYSNEERSSWYLNLGYDLGSNLALDRQLLIGGRRGLRGYPAEFQSGTRRLLFQVEKRYFTHVHLFRLARIGYAFYFDAGRAWNESTEANNEWLSDVGMGLRLAPSRAFNKSILHVDLAFPLNNKVESDSYQLSIQMKRHF